MERDVVIRTEVGYNLAAVIFIFSACCFARTQENRPESCG
jgi:hypothetical protein